MALAVFLLMTTFAGEGFYAGFLYGKNKGYVKARDHYRQQLEFKELQF